MRVARLLDGCAKSRLNFKWRTSAKRNYVGCHDFPIFPHNEIQQAGSATAQPGGKTIHNLTAAKVYAVRMCVQRKAQYSAHDTTCFSAVVGKYNVNPPQGSVYLECTTATATGTSSKGFLVVLAKGGPSPVDSARQNGVEAIIVAAEINEVFFAQIRPGPTGIGAAGREDLDFLVHGVPLHAKFGLEHFNDPQNGVGPK